MSYGDQGQLHPSTQTWEDAIDVCYTSHSAPTLDVYLTHTHMRAITQWPIHYWATDKQHSLPLNKFTLHNQNKTLNLWRFDLFQRPSSETSNVYTLCPKKRPRRNKLQLLYCSLSDYLLLFTASYYLHSPILWSVFIFLVSHFQSHQCYNRLFSETPTFGGMQHYL